MECFIHARHYYTPLRVNANLNDKEDRSLIFSYIGILANVM